MGTKIKKIYRFILINCFIIFQAIGKRKRDPTEEKRYSHYANIVKLYDVYEDNLSIYLVAIGKRKRDPTEEKRYSHYANVVKLYDVYEDNLSIYLVVELCLGGELLSTIMSLKYFSEREAAAMLRLANAI
ncbi:unnamed protein product [Gongylonema pulchrum]|uniref:Protein kinase domain-containing protein n=1 Tax=Gongylonema pulchrum TaxID=637853 RepID=A0A3P7SD98_9BILA|nr:unnamed protein product [Gongylonema pulchrum]